MALKVSAPETETGALRLVVEPSPSWPESLPPQQYPEPAVETAQTCTADEMELKLMPPVTGTGTILMLSAVDPVPSSPARLSPQQ